MSFVKFLLGVWASWVAVKVIRGVMAARVGRREDDPRIKPNGKAMLELVACPKCGIYTSAPCPNCNP